ncbi:hypothetical protein C0J52_23413 [Blattella germanica]|nr:hypothetical protein C0J52_23413 [Blattella germanica]
MRQRHWNIENIRGAQLKIELQNLKVLRQNTLGLHLNIENIGGAQLKIELQNLKVLRQNTLGLHLLYYI